MLVRGGHERGSGSSSSVEVGADGVQQIEVTISDAGCEPQTIVAGEGPACFTVRNDGSSAVTEFEVLDGGRIIGEAENVFPRVEKAFSLNLQPGTFVTYCPNGGIERGTLEVVTGAG
ncbi:cupredoxin domain-containing protein [Rhabdothermincola sediminis]|uniref:cupredoxin domain-containing protein n=1 Tax=Rhabdothermincola sediminis TaxID=2751370 RepID=UPI0027DA2C56|nr:cupredoxin domain-containing protein [Rhabdothermincola sediminis]